MRIFILSFIIIQSVYAQDCQWLSPVDTTQALVLGNGTPNSVNANILQAALDTGGIIRFNMGAGPTAINISNELVVTKAVVLDGEGLITLNGTNNSRILRIENPDNQAYTLALQNMRLINGNSGSTGDISNSGAAIFKPSGGPWQAVNLHIFNVNFENNHATQLHQDGGGGAIYAVGLNDILINQSSFIKNSGSNGGAFYSLGSKNIHITGSLFDGNQATGNGGNPGNGGNGGAIGIDGGERSFNLCQSKIINNQANAFGAGFFSVMYDQNSLSYFTNSTFMNNVNSTDSGLAGGAYIQGGPFVITKSAIIGNQASGAGGLFLGPQANGSIVNSTISGNVATESLAGAMAIDASAEVNMNHLTITNNQAPCPVCFAAGISLSANNQVTMSNSILSNNIGGNAFNPWNIRFTVNDGGGNIQFPQFRSNGQPEVAATANTLWADPLLNELADNGGHTLTMSLNDNSPAINAANPINTTDSDQRGYGRFQQSDSGAFEYMGSDLIFINDFE